jgi:hypothetical protein
MRSFICSDSLDARVFRFDPPVPGVEAGVRP